MRKHLFITVILLIASVFITVVYFKNLNTPGMRTDRIMRVIPGDALLIFEFNNDKTFYDIFNNNQLFEAVAGKQKLNELNTLRKQLLLSPFLEKFVTSQNVFISIHPSKTDTVALLFTFSPASGFKLSAFDQFSKQPQPGMVVTPMRSGNKQGYNIYIESLKKRFYIIETADNIFSGSFEKELVDKSLSEKWEKGNPVFSLLSAQQNANSLANLYINYGQLSAMFDLLFKNKNTDILKGVELLPALGTLSLNYRTDALMFNGATDIQEQRPASYLNLYTRQQPVTNHLKEVFPATTAYSINFAIADPLKFSSELSKWHTKAGLDKEKDLLFNKVKAETGVNLKTEFNNLLGNEFAVLTTKYFEKFAIISIKNGSKVKQLIAGISAMPGAAGISSNKNNVTSDTQNLDDLSETSGQFNYDKLPFFLLGDAFGVFRRPYYLVIDNYLILANSSNELTSYYDTYINRKFLNKNEQYNEFDNLLAERSNVTFFFQFKNSLPILKRDLYPNIYNIFDSDGTGWGYFYGASLQFTATEKNFYTNFCMKLNTDTAIAKKN